MGLKDGLKNLTSMAIDKTKEAVNQELQRNKDNRDRNEKMIAKSAELNNLTKTKINILNGANLIGKRNSVIMRQLNTHEVIFDLDDSTTYFLIGYTWNGPQYKTITNSQTLAEERTKGKSGKVLVGGLIGSIAAIPTAGVSTLVGAGMGAMSKGKKNSASSTKSVSEQVEINTPATIKLINSKTKQIVGLGIVCNSYIDTEINKFLFVEENSINIKNETFQTDDIDSYEKVKKAKELLDMGIITQEEFDQKKKELLGL